MYSKLLNLNECLYKGDYGFLGLIVTLAPFLLKDIQLLHFRKYSLLGTFMTIFQI